MIDTIAITALGQAGFAFRQGGLTILIDPYLTDSCDYSSAFPLGFWRRSYPPPFSPHWLSDIDLVLCTHDHLDHLDPGTLCAIARASPHCRLAGPQMSAELMKQAGISSRRIDALDAGIIFSFRGIRIRPIPAAHETVEKDAAGHHRFLSYLIHWGRWNLFHAGDTVPHRRLAAALSGRRVDVGFLPINGRDSNRKKLGIVGNMNTAEAATFAHRHKFELVVPMHHDLYTNNGASLPAFVAELEAADRRLKFKAFRPGEQILIPTP